MANQFTLSIADLEAPVKKTVAKKATINIKQHGNTTDFTIYRNGVEIGTIGENWSGRWFAHVTAGMGGVYLANTFSKVADWVEKTQS